MENITKQKDIQCVKGLSIQCFSGLHFSAFSALLRMWTFLRNDKAGNKLRKICQVCEETKI